MVVLVGETPTTRMQAKLYPGLRVVRGDRWPRCARSVAPRCSSPAFVARCGTACRSTNERAKIVLDKPEKDVILANEIPFCREKMNPNPDPPPPATIATVERETGLSKDSLRVWER